MAFSGFTTSNYASISSGLVTAAPLTMLAIGKLTTPADSGTLMSLANSGSASNRNNFRLLIGSDAKVNFNVSDGSTSTFLADGAPGTIASDTWTMCGAIAYDASNRAVFRNNHKTTGSGSRTPSGINRVGLGIIPSSSVSTPFSNGSLGYCALWNDSLSDEEVAAFTAGYPPSMIRPQSLVDWWPMIRENIAMKGNALTITGSLSAAPHHPVICP